MNVEELRDYCLAMHAVEENAPWKDARYSMLVTFSIGGKWFCLLDSERKFINVKSEPEKIQNLISRFQGASPAWHMNKSHWIGITLESDVPDCLIKELLEEGYKLVASGLSRKMKEALGINNK